MQRIRYFVLGSVSLAFLLLFVTVIAWQLETLFRGSEPFSLDLIDPLTKSDVGERADLELVTVAEVVDGDTIRLSDGRVIRYIGIDTPETKHPQQGIECFGQAASQRNKELVVGKQVQLEKDTSETDRYGRLLRYVWLEGHLVNEQLIAEGYAVAISYPPDIKYQEQLRKAEEESRQKNLGLWAVCPD